MAVRCSAAERRNWTTLQFTKQNESTKLCLIFWTPSVPLSTKHMFTHCAVKQDWNHIQNSTPVEMWWHTQKPHFVFRRNGRVHLNRRGASVQSTTGSQGVRISGSNAGYTMFRGSVKSTGYPLHSPVSPLHFPSRASPYAITFQLESTPSVTH